MKRLAALAINQQGFAFNSTNGQSFKFNETGFYILEALGTSQDSHTIAKDMTNHFAVSYEEAYNDVVEFLETLALHSLLETDHEYGTHIPPKTPRIL